MGLHKYYHNAGTRRIAIRNRIATYNGKGALTLSYALSRECGCFEAEGVSRPESNVHWSYVYEAARALAESENGEIEIYASHPQWGYWQVGIA